MLHRAMRHRSLVSRALDHLDYVVTYTRLRIFDWIYGPEPPTPADEQRERDRERLRKGCGWSWHRHHWKDRCGNLRWGRCVRDWWLSYSAASVSSVALSCMSSALRSASTACLTASSSSVAAIAGTIRIAALSANTPAAAKSRRVKFVAKGG